MSRKESKEHFLCRISQRKCKAIFVLCLLSVIPIILSLVVFAFWDYRFEIDDSNQMELLAIPIVLAAYIAAVRVALTGRLAATRQLGFIWRKEYSKKKRIQCILLYLIPVDFLFLVSAILMSIIVFFLDCHCCTTKRILENVVVFSLMFAVVYLALLHVSAWFTTFDKTFHSES